jgi:rhodanese-related sulfurtransferase
MRRMPAIAVAALLITIVAAHPAVAADKTPDQLVKEAKTVIKEVSIGDVKKMIDAKEAIIILDVTDKQEFEAGHLPGAMNISRGTLEFKSAMMLPDKKARIVVYCGLDLRSPLATRTLNELGYANAVNMAGGLKAWKAAGYPVAP